MSMTMHVRFISENGCLVSQPLIQGNKIYIMRHGLSDKVRHLTLTETKVHLLSAMGNICHLQCTTRNYSKCYTFSTERVHFNFQEMMCQMQHVFCCLLYGFQQCIESISGSCNFVDIINIFCRYIKFLFVVKYVYLWLILYI